MRKIQPVSFNMEDAYERNLHEYALEQGKFFSRYVKRLIDKDRSGVADSPVVNTPKIVEESKPKKFGKADARAFLT